MSTKPANAAPGPGPGPGPGSAEDEAGEAALIARHVGFDPRGPAPADARLIDSGGGIWALVAYRDANLAGLDAIAHAYQTSPEAIRAAFAFYRRHPGAIDGRVAANA